MGFLFRTARLLPLLRLSSAFGEKTLENDGSSWKSRSQAPNPCASGQDSLPDAMGKEGMRLHRLQSWGEMQLAPVSIPADG